MKVRKATRKDVKHILKIVSTAKEVEAYEGNKPDENFIRTHLSNPYNVMLVCGSLTAEMWQDKKYAFISTIVVHKETRGRGVGTMLYEAFEKSCKSHHIKAINFLVQTTNKKMQKWSEKKGFFKGHSMYFYEKGI
jgi:N-acetylglutamate synthase-like GNAT family acetyltransferase